jgi:hypothetical protein
MDKKEFAKYVKDRYEQNPNGRFDRFGKDYIDNGKFDIKVVYKDESTLSWGESYIGTNFGSTVDYGRTYEQLKSGEMTNEELKQDVRQRILRSPRQINFVEKNDDREVETVYTGVAVVVKENGYAIYPDPESKVSV